MRHDLLFRGAVYGSSGYATASRYFLAHLMLTKKYNIMLDALKWNSGFSVSEERELFLLLKALEKNKSVDLKKAFLLHWSIGSEFLGRLGCHRAIGHTIFETNSLINSFVLGCNNMDAIMVPTSFNQKTFQEAGVKVPVFVVPEGVDTNRFTPQGPLLKVVPENKFTFLSIAQFSYRKGLDLLLRAFLELFGNRKDAQLILRWYIRDGSPAETQRLSAYIKQFREKVMGGNQSGNIYLMSNVEDVYLPALYRSAQAVVSPFRGEGWGLTLVEALASEVPVIATNWGGPSTYLNQELALLLDYEMRTIPEFVDKEHLGNHLSEARKEKHMMAEPDFEQLKWAMWEMYQNYFLYKAQAIQAREYLVQNYSWMAAANKFEDVIEAFL